MSKKIIRNPSDVPITKTTTKRNNPMATSSITSSKAISEFSEQAKTALYILGGQAIASQANSLIVPSLLENQSSTIKQVAKSGIPLTLGVVLALTVKNKYIRGLSLGFGTQGILEAIKLVMPDFNPTEGFSDGSSFVFTDENGQEQVAFVTPQGEIVTANGQPMQLPAQSKTKSNFQSSSAGGQLGEWADSNYAEEVDYV